MKKILSKLTLAVLAIGLLGSCSKINERIDGLEGRLDGLENEKIASIQTQVGNISNSISDLGTIRTNIQSLTDGAKAQGEDITDLQAADQALDKRIGDLRKFVADTLPSFAKTEWVKATFATLEQHKATCDTIAKINEKFGKANDQLAKSIQACADSLNWINRKFDGYYTIAQMNAIISGLKAQMDTTTGVTDARIDSLAEELSKAKADIDTAKAVITREYQAAIDTAITALDGKLTAALQNEIAAVNGTVSALLEKMDGLSAGLAEIKGMVQSIELIPEYAGPTILVKYTGDITDKAEFDDVTIRYKITPASVVDSIFKFTFNPRYNPASFFKLYYRGVNYPTKAFPYDNSIAVKSIAQDRLEKGVINVVVDGKEWNKIPVRGLITDHSTVSVSLGLKYGITDYMSSFTDLYFKVKEDVLEAERSEVYKELAFYVGSRQLGREYNPYRVLFNMCGDDVCAADAYKNGYGYIAQLNDFTYDANNEVIYNCYTNFYKAIDECNKFLSHYEENPDTQQKKQYVAEVRVLRAWLHLTLATGWGNPPLITEYPAPKFPTNCDHKEILGWCVKECEEAMGDLAERNGKGDKEGATHVTKGFAQGVAGKAALFAGDNAKAAACLKPLVENPRNYDLVPGERFFDLFHIQGNGCEEKIFELDIDHLAGFNDFEYPRVPYIGTETRLWACNDKAFIASPWSGGQAAKSAWGLGMPDFDHQFLADDGDSYRRKATFLTSDEVFYDDGLTSYGDDDLPLTRAEKEFYPKIGIKIGGLYGQTDVIPCKLVVRKEDVHPGTGTNKTNFTVMRLGEAYLLYAEACIQAGDTREAREYINKIQRRAGSQTISNDNDMATTAAAMNELMREKGYELWMEGCRWADLMRWGNSAPSVAISRLNAAGTKVYVSYDEYVTSGGNKPHKLYYQPKEIKPTGSFASEKHRYFPYPASVIATNHNLNQNPGW